MTLSIVTSYSLKNPTLLICYDHYDHYDQCLISLAFSPTSYCDRAVTVP